MTFSGSLATKCMSLNNEPYMVRSTHIYLNPIELNCYPFIISLEKCNRSCNAVCNLYMKICVLSETKDVNIKVFNKIRKINEAKTVAKYVSSDC